MTYSPNKHLEFYTLLLLEIATMKEEYRQHLNGKPNGDFYKSNWKTKRKALKVCIEDFEREAEEWKYDHPENFV